VENVVDVEHGMIFSYFHRNKAFIGFAKKHVYEFPFQDVHFALLCRLSQKR